MSIEYKINKQLNGVEISFSEKPSAEVLAKLKALGFRWNPGKCVWYAKITDERLEFAKSIQDNTTYEQISLFATEDEGDPLEVEEKPQDEPKKEKKNAVKTTSKVLPKDKDLSIEEIASRARKVKPKDDTKIIEFAKASPHIKVRMAFDESATIEECTEKINKEKAIFKDSDSQFVLDGLLEMCKVNANFRNNFMRENKTYMGAFEYFSNLARDGYAHMINGVAFMDNNLALGFAMDYYNKIDE